MTTNEKRKGGRQATGTLYTLADGNVTVRVSMGGKVKVTVPLERPDSEGVRAAVPTIAAYMRSLRDRMTPDAIGDLFTQAAKRMMHVSDNQYAKKWSDAQKENTLSQLVTVQRTGMTFKEAAQLWTSGKLNAQYANIPATTKHDANEGVFRKHVYDLVGNVPIADFDKEHFGVVYHAMGKSGSRDYTRIHAWKLIQRVCNLAIDPLKVRAYSPIRKGDRPKAADTRRTPALMPEDDDQLLGCRDVCIHNRVLWGFLAREGSRRGEALTLRWCDITAPVLSAYNWKTGKEQARLLDAGVKRALLRYRELFRPGESEDQLVIRSTQFRSHHFRRDLRRAGVFKRRPELAMHSKERGERRQVRPHDNRRFFVTLATAQDRSDAHIRARTGHTNAQMIAHYTDLAEVHKSLGRVELTPMDQAIPELRDQADGHEQTAAE